MSTHSLLCNIFTGQKVTDCKSPVCSYTIVSPPKNFARQGALNKIARTIVNDKKSSASMLIDTSVRDRGPHCCQSKQAKIIIILSWGATNIARRKGSNIGENYIVLLGTWSSDPVIVNTLPCILVSVICTCTCLH